MVQLSLLMNPLSERVRKKVLPSLLTGSIKSLNGARFSHDSYNEQFKAMLSRLVGELHWNKVLPQHKGIDPTPTISWLYMCNMFAQDTIKSEYNQQENEETWVRLKLTLLESHASCFKYSIRSRQTILPTLRILKLRRSQKWRAYPSSTLLSFPRSLRSFSNDIIAQKALSNTFVRRCIVSLQKCILPARCVSLSLPI